ncbi:phage major capsid protein [Bacillus thuringiensis LM1212]|uniref:phage major capsid protein n=1 Tax=Bacillus cereus group TaxID=86661 RepID=UPI0003FEAA23|nr:MULTISPECIES: phage major capsid protein [Bacillus cereus group]AXY08537.1 phage major capsid protein [Bacillus thuringiensis LM1212]AXY10595.1 phage major capsid protein [Bacillus thuringiensis LM1212]QDF23496.1 phage major capsid protein [Bacillus tropicus]QDF26827.1 phage major capsid protein [Bacillus tropicus]QUG94776.1 phage major capsid protein [Bacillus tropicus]
MTIKNLDRSVIENKESQITNVKEALENGDAQAVAERIVTNMEGNMQHIQDMMKDIINEAQQAKDEKWDAQVLAARGVRALTNEEQKFYNAAIEVQSFDEVTKLMPPTIFERVFEDLEKEHPLLSLINFQTTGATTQWVLRKEGASVVFWGDVCDNIKEMTDEGFYTVDQGMFKLSGFLVVCKAMFELGPSWLDKYVRTFMKEVVAEELENVVVSGTGKKQPIGMIKDLKGAVTDGIYPDKEPVVLNDFSPKTIGKEILAPTTKKGTRRYTGVTLIVNPLDYATKFFPIGAKRKDDGTWTYDNFGVPGLTMVQSPAVPLNRMISGKPKDYFMGVGSEQKLESTDVLRMVEDQRLYLIRQLANGRPLDHDSFTVFDITALEPKEGTPTP